MGAASRGGVTGCGPDGPRAGGAGTPEVYHPPIASPGGEAPGAISSRSREPLSPRHPSMERRAKIVATLGPATNDERMLARLLSAGADVLRFNLSHGDLDSHRATLRLVRRVSREQKRHTPVLLDLMGPRYRLGVLPDGPRSL